MNYFINYESFNEYNENMANALVTESAMNFYNILGGDQLDIGLESFSNITSNNDPVLEGLKDNIVSAGSSIKNAITKGWATITEKWNAFVTWIKGLIKKKPKVDGEKANIFVRAWNKIVGIFKAGVDKIASLFSNKSDIADESFINLDFALEGAGEDWDNDDNWAKAVKKPTTLANFHEVLKKEISNAINAAKEANEKYEKKMEEKRKKQEQYDEYMRERQDIEAEANANNVVSTEKIVNATISSGNSGVLSKTKSVLSKLKTPAAIAAIIGLSVAAIAGGITLFKLLAK